MKYLFGIFSLFWFGILISFMFFDYQPSKVNIGSAFFLSAFYFLVEAINQHKEAK